MDNNSHKKSSRKYLLGVISCFHSLTKIPPFPEKVFFEQLTQMGKQWNIFLIFFNPKQIDWLSRTVKAWHFLSSGKWIFSSYPLPNLIYDRCFYQNGKHYLSYKPAITRIVRDPHIRLLGRPLGGKLQTYQMLLQDDQIAPFLPRTIAYRSPKQVLFLLQHKSSLLLKPNGGSLGSGVIAIQKTPTHYQITGRNSQNLFIQQQFFGAQQLAIWLKQFIKETRYIIQPYLKLTTPDDRPFDLRILVQKNEKHEWETTGMAVRIGNPSTVTSNLHGGGQALQFQPFIDEQFPKEKVTQIKKQIQHLTKRIPSFIESKHGPLLELGIDIGIDQQGKVWLLEVNSKPGRAVFLKTGQHDLRERSIQLPIRYAYSLFMGGKAG